jgi:hypothetical protein
VDRRRLPGSFYGLRFRRVPYDTGIGSDALPTISLRLIIQAVTAEQMELSELAFCMDYRSAEAGLERKMAEVRDKATRFRFLEPQSPLPCGRHP